MQNYNGLPFEITPVIIEISDVVRNSTDQTLGLKALSSQPLQFSNTDPAGFAVNCVEDSASRKGNNFGKVDLIQEFVQCKTNCHFTQQKQKTTQFDQNIIVRGCNESHSIFEPMNFTETHEVIPQVFTYKETDYILAPPTKVTHTPNEQIKDDKNTNCIPKLRKSVITPINSPVRNIIKDDLYCPKKHESKYQHAVNIDLLPKHIQSYEKSIRQTIVSHCVCCKAFLFQEQIHLVPEGYAVLNGLGLHRLSHYCYSCANQLRNGNIPLTCTQNNLDAGVVPQVFHSLNNVEKRLISQIQNYMTVIVLPGGQYAEKGMVIHFPLNITNYTSTLNKVTECQYLIVSPNKNINCSVVSGKNLANFQQVKDALIWLKQHNPLYATFKNLSLPLDDSSDLNRKNLKSTKEFLNTIDIDVQFGTVNTNYTVPDIPIEAVLDPSSCYNIELPIKFNSPVWIDKIPHGEELCFPWLFPIGKSGITDKRDGHITKLKYFHHRFYNIDPRWRKDITYLMHAVNHFEQSKLSADIGIFMQTKKPGNHGLRYTQSNITFDQHLRNNSYMFMKNIRGTAAYWADILYNLLATVKCLGPPTLFLTLSADDNHWPELIMLLRCCSYEEACTMNSATQEVRKDPLLASIHFERRWKNFFKHILKGKDNPLGLIIDWFARVEYQARGSPHMHIFLWIQGAPNLKNGSVTDIENYISSIISTTIPDQNTDPDLYQLVKRLQIHHHTNTCNRQGRSFKSGNCRFGFPYKPSKVTKLLSNVNYTSPNSRSKFYETYRSDADTMVNAYNPYLLKRWRANMDIQMVSGASGLAYYVCSYIAKAEPDDLRQSLSQVITNILSQPIVPPIRTQLMKIGNCVLKTRKLSAQEATARIGNIQLVYSSRTVVFLNTRLESKRYKLLKPKSQRASLPENSTDIFYNNIIDYYRLRPKDLSHLSLFKFSSMYKLSASDKIPTSRRSQPRIRLANGKLMQKRTHTCIIRTPSFSRLKDDYYFSLLLLHLPHYDESSLIQPFTTAKEAFLHKYQQLNLTDFQYESHLHDLEKVIHMMQSDRSYLASMVAPSTHEFESPETGNCTEDLPIISQVEANTTDLNTLSTDSMGDTLSKLHRLKLNTLSDKQIEARIDCLSNNQTEIFLTVQKHFETHCNKSLHMFITGGAGTGKSFLIKTIIEWLRTFTAFQSFDPVLVCAPTGVSAKNIGGQTLHTAFRLPVQHGFEPSFKELSAASLSTLRELYRHVHTLVIDEVSMVSSNMLSYINRRLISIKQKNDYFGGISVILLGDFYQLRPVRGQFAFTNTLLWNLFDCYTLEQNMRQKNDNQYKTLLNKVRVGQLDQDDIELLKTRLITNDDPEFEGALRLFPTMAEVKKYNIIKQNQLKYDMITIQAEHDFADCNLSDRSEPIEQFIPDDDRDAGGLPASLTLCTATRVMLIRNIATDYGMVNGILGFVTQVESDKNIPIRIYICKI